MALFARNERMLLRLALILFGCRALVPVGYMPASLADASLLMPCHGTLAGQLLARLGTPAATHAHDHHAGQDESSDPPTSLDAWEHCPLGAVASSAALASQPTLGPLPSARFESPCNAGLASLERLLAGHYRARAPPHA